MSAGAEVPLALSQADAVVFGVKEMILQGRLSPGGRLPIEKDLALELRVSRSSLREGIRALSVMGVIETRRGDGTYVTSLDPSLLMVPMSFLVDLQQRDNAVDLHAVRRTLETQAAQLAALTMDGQAFDEAEGWLIEMEALLDSDVLDHDRILICDIQFHRVIAKGSGNPVLEALIGALTSETVRGRLWRAIEVADAEQATLAEHRTILAALRARAPERAGLRMGNHLLQVEEFLSEASPVGERVSQDLRSTSPSTRD